MDTGLPQPRTNDSGHADDDDASADGGMERNISWAVALSLKTRSGPGHSPPLPSTGAKRWPAAIDFVTHRRSFIGGRSTNYLSPPHRGKHARICWTIVPRGSQVNLYDAVRRPDLALKVRGSARTSEPIHDGVRKRAVVLSAGSRITIADANKITALASLPTYPGWKCLPGGRIRISIEIGGQNHLIWKAHPDDQDAREIKLNWPTKAGTGAFDLIIDAIGDADATLCVGDLHDSRRKIRQLIKGKGVEVGAGIRPLVKPTEEIDVLYVEEKAVDDWLATYAKTDIAIDHLTPEVLDRYRVGSALTLSDWEDGSLDFIFSNHVFEHLMNPAQVLRNWMKRLKPGGYILGAIPDARYTFDLRQPLTQRSEFSEELASGLFDVPDIKYERWCRYTAPYASPQNLRSRGYSVHIHNYTPDNFRELCQLALSEEYPPLFLDCSPNNKDFGFALRKTE